MLAGRKQSGLSFTASAALGLIVLLALRQRVGESVFFHSAELELCLWGIPLDQSPLLSLCKKLGHRAAMLVPCAEKHIDDLNLSTAGITLEPVGLISSSRFKGDTAISGVIAKNPFFRKASTLKRLGMKNGSQIALLVDSEILCCSLKDWHDVGDVADEYYLTNIESRWIGQALVVRPAVRTGVNHARS